jgi:uncharacterized membrane protein
MRTYLIALSFWLHLLGILIWVGTALIMPLVAWPATLVLDPEYQQRYKDAFLARLTPWVLRAMILIILSGLFQIYMIYGFGILLSINTLSLKLLIFILMLINSGRGIALRDKLKALRDTGIDTTGGEYLHLKQQEERNQWIQVGLTVLILLVVGLLTSGILTI